MPILLVDPVIADKASVIKTSTERGDERTYYVVPCSDGQPDALIVCRNGLKLPNLSRQIVDAATGFDEGYVGFTRPNSSAKIGQKLPSIVHSIMQNPTARYRKN